MAPVNAPFSWPNSSLSISSDGIAAQLTFTNGPLARLERSWMARATSSLPVPFSPVISTRPDDGAVLASLSTIARIAALLPIIECSASARAFHRAFSRARRPNSSAFLTTISSLSPVSGFSMKSWAPRLVACTAVSSVALPDIITTITSG